MWHINKLKNKAVEKLNAVKKSVNGEHEEGERESFDGDFKARCLELSEKIEEREKIIEELKKEKIDFRVFIGKIESGDLVTEIEIEEIRKVREELRCEKDNVIRLENLIESDKVKYKTEVEELNKSVLAGLEKLEKFKYEALEASDQFSRYKTRVNNTISEIFTITKENFNILGLSMPSIKAENLGLEDIKEFIFTQSEYLKNAISALNSISAKNQKTGKTLEDFCVIFKDSLTECIEAKKITEEKMKSLENYQKEKENLAKNNKKLSDRIKILFEEIKKNNENLKIIEGLKDDIKKLESKNVELTRKNDEFEKENIGVKAKLQNLQGKLQSKAEEFDQLQENSDNLKKRLKNLNSVMAEKEKQIESLIQEKSAVESNLSKAISEVEQIKNDCAQVIDQNKQENLEELEELKSAFTIKTEELNKQLKSTQNDLKNSTIENIQLHNKLKKISEIEQSYSLLAEQNLKNQEKINLLNKDLEKNEKILESKKNAKKTLKKKIVDLENFIENLNVEVELQKRTNEEIKIEFGKVAKDCEILKEKVKAGEKPGVGFIDKRIIVTFFMNFYSDRNSANAKRQMLRALAEMLEMNNEQKVKIGIYSDASFYSQLTGFLSRS